MQLLEMFYSYLEILAKAILNSSHPKIAQFFPYKNSEFWKLIRSFVYVASLTHTYLQLISYARVYIRKKKNKRPILFDVNKQKA